MRERERSPAHARSPCPFPSEGTLQVEFCGLRNRRSFSKPAARAPCLCAAVLTLALIPFPATRGARAQPSDLTFCFTTPDEPLCVAATSGWSYSADCERFFLRLAGHVAFGPLRCVGPIVVEIETYIRRGQYYPVYVEIVPLSDGSVSPCADTPGHVVLVARGQENEPCGTWARTFPTDITSVVPLGSTYAVRAWFPRGPTLDTWSPSMDCLRVTAIPSPVSSLSWSHVRHLYR